MIKLRGSKKSGYILGSSDWCIAITWSELKAIARITYNKVFNTETNKIFKEMLGENKYRDKIK